MAVFCLFAPFPRKTLHFPETWARACNPSVPGSQLGAPEQTCGHPQFLFIPMEKLSPIYSIPQPSQKPVFQLDVQSSLQDLLSKMEGTSFKATGTLPQPSTFRIDVTAVQLSPPEAHHHFWHPLLRSPPTSATFLHMVTTLSSLPVFQDFRTCRALPEACWPSLPAPPSASPLLTPLQSAPAPEHRVSSSCAQTLPWPAAAPSPHRPAPCCQTPSLACSFQGLLWTGKDKKESSTLCCRWVFPAQNDSADQVSLVREKPGAQQDVSRECWKCCCATWCVCVCVSGNAWGVQGVLSQHHR